MSRDPIYERDVVGVFRDRAGAERAVAALRQAGMGSATIRIDRERDEVTSLRGEMREEVDQMVTGPGVGGVTKEAQRTLARTVPLFAAIGAVVLLPLAFLPIDLHWAARLILAALVGAVAGSVYGFVVGGGLGMKRPTASLAAERGVTVAVRAANPDEAERVVDEMKRLDPIRVDLTTLEGDPTAMATTEEEQAETG
ncbi:MAG TPA: hypothetical protein VKA30_00190 [Actinomycetota bacterium]|nr:hypothetical protein [Actinomycetota bacterium]